MKASNIIKVLLCITTYQLVLCKTNEKEKILSRQRRYLIFPEGSSFQLGKEPFKVIFFYIIYTFLHMVVDAIKIIFIKKTPTAHSS